MLQKKLWKNSRGALTGATLLLLLLALGGWPELVARAVARLPEKPQGAVAETANPSQKNVEDGFQDEAERELTRLLNQERIQQGLPAFAPDERLVQSSRAHSLRMAEQRLLSHGLPSEPELPQRMAEAGIRFDRSGENVAFGPDVLAIHRGLMNSPGHRANILHRDFTAVGIGIVLRHEQLWVTQNFARRLAFQTAESAEALLVREFEQLRRKSGQKPLQREQVRGLREAACRMASTGTLSTSEAKNLFGAGGSAAFSGAEIGGLPSEWRKIADYPGLSRYAVAVCFQKSPKLPSGGYWAVMVFQ
ncbi:MAG: CAP domain-containing protein [Candidatus Korobacteraceae bacterium]